jgi:SET domain-containing protein
MKSNLAQKNKPRERKAQGISGAHIGWKTTKGKGRGVFAGRRIRKGQLVEIAPVIPVAEKNMPEDEAPDGYFLSWHDKEGQEYAMVLGYVMLYNHSGKPNIELEMDLRSRTMSVHALRDIKPGEELVWDYNCDLWFDPKK